jgi:hypothetical protein
MMRTEKTDDVKKSRVKNFTPRLNLIIGLIFWLIVYSSFWIPSQKYKIDILVKVFGRLSYKISALFVSLASLPLNCTRITPFFKALAVTTFFPILTSCE